MLIGIAVDASPHIIGMLADACGPVLCLCNLLVQGVCCVLLAVCWYKASWQRLVGAWVVAGACQARAQELGQPGLHRLFVKRLVARAMDRHAREREMASSLLSTLYSQARCRGLATCLWKAALAQDGVETLCLLLQRIAVRWLRHRQPA